jgi:hypothetical protein
MGSAARSGDLRLLAGPTMRWLAETLRRDYECGSGLAGERV